MGACPHRETKKNGAAGRFWPSNRPIKRARRGQKPVLRSEHSLSKKYPPTWSECLLTGQKTPIPPPVSSKKKIEAQKNAQTSRAKRISNGNRKSSVKFINVMYKKQGIKAVFQGFWRIFVDIACKRLFFVPACVSSSSNWQSFGFTIKWSFWTPEPAWLLFYQRHYFRNLSLYIVESHRAAILSAMFCNSVSLGKTGIARYIASCLLT